MPASATEPHCPACNGTGLSSESYDEGTIYSCPHCRLQWARRSASAIEGNIDITGVHDHYMAPESIDPARYEPYRSFFAAIDSRQGARPLRILDIGSGNGVFMAEAARQGHDVFGIELDERHRTVIPPALLARVEFAAVEAALPRMAGNFDVITFWDSFEHLDDPFALLEHVRPRLTQNGIVFARVNNRHDIFNLMTSAALALAHDWLGRRLLKACFNLPQHAWNFSRRGMALLLGRHGWDIWRSRATETPVSRLTTRPLTGAAITLAYGLNRLIGGGKIGEYYFVPRVRN